MRRITVALILVLTVCLCLTALEFKDFTFNVLSEKKLNGIYIPWPEDASKTAKKTGTLRFYFMSSEDMQGGNFAYGDSCFIVFPNGETMIIDGGKGSYASVLMKNLENLGVKRIDHMVITHLHEDHYGGLLLQGFFSEFKVGKVYWNGVGSYYDSVTKNLQTFAAKSEGGLTSLSAGDSIVVGDVRIDILYPKKEMQGKIQEASDQALNNTSLLLKITYGGFSALFGGDLYSDTEETIIGLYPDALDVDLVKANHHGKTTSNSRDWAKATSPAVAVATSGIPMDLFPYGSYSAVGSYVLNDNLDGYVRIVTDGKTCEVTSSRQRTKTINENFDIVARGINPVTVKTVKK